MCCWKITTHLVVLFFIIFFTCNAFNYFAFLEMNYQIFKFTIAVLSSFLFIAVFLFNSTKNTNVFGVHTTYYYITVICRITPACFLARVPLLVTIANVVENTIKCGLVSDRSNTISFLPPPLLQRRLFLVNLSFCVPASISGLSLVIISEEPNNEITYTYMCVYINKICIISIVIFR